MKYIRKGGETPPMWRYTGRPNAVREVSSYLPMQSRASAGVAAAPLSASVGHAGVGAGVGEGVGAALGEGVGAGDGEDVGCGLGADVGATVGAGVGGRDVHWKVMRGGAAHTPASAVAGFASRQPLTTVPMGSHGRRCFRSSHGTCTTSYQSRTLSSRTHLLSAGSTAEAK
jgi:hypothetical protein